MMRSRRLREDTSDGGPALFVTTPWREDEQAATMPSLPSTEGEIVGKRYKVDLPNYGVFDDKRVFCAGTDARADSASGGCGSAYRSARMSGRPMSSSASPRPAAKFFSYPTGRPTRPARPTCGCSWASSAWSRVGLPFVYLNQVGGQDEVVYDGASFALGADRSLKAKLASFAEQVATIEFRRGARAVGNASPGRSRPSWTASTRSIRRWCSACATM